MLKIIRAAASGTMFLPRGPGRRRLSMIAVLCGVLGIGAARTVSEPVFIGVLRNDGLLIPTAIYDGKEWWNRWPFSNESDETVTKLALPGSLSQIPPAWLPPRVTFQQRWSVCLLSGGRRAIRLGRPRRPRGWSLAAFIGIEAQYSSAKAGAQGDDSEAGVAVAGSAELGRFVPASKVDSQSLLTAIRGQLNRAETDAIAERLRLDWEGRHYEFPAGEKARATQPFEGVSFVRSERRDRGRTFYYFIGGKHYGKPYPDCVGVDFHAIVIRDVAGRITAPLTSAYTTFDCSRDNKINLVFTPLATIHWRGPVLWLIRNDAEDGFDYSLINPVAKGDADQIQLKGLWQLRESGG